MQGHAAVLIGESPRSFQGFDEYPAFESTAGVAQLAEACAQDGLGTLVSDCLRTGTAQSSKAK